MATVEVNDKAARKSAYNSKYKKEHPEKIKEHNKRYYLHTKLMKKKVDLVELNPSSVNEFSSILIKNFNQETNNNVTAKLEDEGDIDKLNAFRQYVESQYQPYFHTYKVNFLALNDQDKIKGAAIITYYTQIIRYLYDMIIHLTKAT